MSKKREVSHVTMVGGGLMGSTITAAYAAGGVRVAIVDVSHEALETSRIRTRAAVRTLFENGLAAEGEEELLSRVRWTTNLRDAVRGSALVHEAVPEIWDLKAEVFRELDDVCDRDAVLATNTSTFRIASLARETRRPECVVGIHFISPAHVLRPVEVVRCELTASETVAIARDFLSSVNKTPIVCNDSPGFIVNRVQLALSSVCHWVVQQGIATPAEVDEAIRHSIGPRLALWGPMRSEDLVVNKQTTLASLEYLYKETGEERYLPAGSLKALVAEGATGLSAGRGWYDYGDSDPAAVGFSADSELIALLRYLDTGRGEGPPTSVFGTAAAE